MSESMQEKQGESITTQICFVTLFVCLFLSAGFSWGTFEHLRNLDAKINVRDSIILRMEQHQEHQDSIMFEHLDKWLNKIYKQ